MGMKELVEALRARRQRALAMGGPEAIAKQHAEGKLTVRERIDRLFDPGSFQEIGLLATHADISPAMKGKETPADGVVTGFGRIGGRPASVIAYDFTVMAGSMGRNAEIKCNRAREVALTKRMPMIWLIDSAGARIQEAIGSTFAGSGFLFREESIMSGVVPMVAAMMGPGAAGTAYIPALSDFVPMVKGTSHMALGGPPLVKAVVGEDVTPGGAGRVQGAYRDLRRRRPRGRGRRRLPRGDQGVSVLLPVVEPRGAAHRPVRRSCRAHGGVPPDHRARQRATRL
jgi:acetyl-CoA carboxylase carboxyltransferase component